MNSTEALCREAIEKATAEGRFAWDFRGLDQRDKRFSLFWCYKQTRCDSRGRPMLGVRDAPEANQHKMLKRARSGKILRNSKNANPELPGKLVTYTNYLTYHVKLKSMGAELPDYPRTHVSHRCHAMSCIRPEHLVVESNELNQQRKGCIGFLICSSCNRVWKLCRHDEYPNTNSKCCLTFKHFVCCGVDVVHPNMLNTFL
jgi:hypothetical protein